MGLSPSTSSGATAISAEFPAKLLPLMEREARRRYYVAYGGRGSAKSWTFARALLIQAMAEPLRVLCAREIMRTIADSVHRLLSDQIAALGLERYYHVQEAAISGMNGAQFLFAGLRQQDAQKIKSFEGVDIAWVEEGQAVSKRSWEILIPTIRVAKSEIWVSFNPELDTDDTYVRFVVDPPQNAWVEKVTFRDNPWFPEVLEGERLELKRRDPVAYENVWEGHPTSVVEGAIYALEVMAMVADRRIGNVPADPALPVHTVWDLGWNDLMSIILVQRLVSEVRIVGYLQGSFRTYAEWVADLERMPYAWGTDWLPHDGASREARTGKSAQEWLKGLGRRSVKIIERAPLEEGIRAARMLFPRAYIDKTKCADLVNSLKRYRRGIPESTGEPGAPIHDQYSHGADAFRGLALCVEQMRNERSIPPRVPERIMADPGVGY